MFHALSDGNIWQLPTLGDPLPVVTGGGVTTGGIVGLGMGVGGIFGTVTTGGGGVFVPVPVFTASPFAHMATVAEPPTITVPSFMMADML